MCEFVILGLTSSEFVGKNWSFCNTSLKHEKRTNYNASKYCTNIKIKCTRPATRVFITRHTRLSSKLATAHRACVSANRHTDTHRVSSLSPQKSGLNWQLMLCAAQNHDHSAYNLLKYQLTRLHMLWHTSATRTQIKLPRIIGEVSVADKTAYVPLSRLTK